MNDRMSVSAQTWRTDAPPVNQQVEVWHSTGCVLATFDGNVWRTSGGSVLWEEITHWRPYHA